MARGPRRDAPDEIHHVWARGIERGAIFYDDRDRLDLLERFSVVLPESGLTCLAWSLLPNHYHLVLKRGPVSLSRAMSRIQSGYATRFNKRHERVGFLFQNRYGSRIVDSDAELISAVRYVVRNPLKHDLCTSDEELARFLWGSASALAGRRAPWPFEALTTTREILEGRHRPAFAADPIAYSVSERRIDDAFAPWIEKVCRELGVSQAAVLGRSRTRDVSDARAALCWIGVTRLGMGGASVAGRLGISRSGVSRALMKGRAVCESIGFGPTTQQLNERPRG